MVKVRLSKVVHEEVHLAARHRFDHKLLVVAEKEEASAGSTGFAGLEHIGAV